MTEDDKYALKELRDVVALTVGFIGFVLLIVIGLSSITNTSDTDESLFEVVDQYKECDVVRYAPPLSAKYEYFLYCENNK